MSNATAPMKAGQGNETTASPRPHVAICTNTIAPYRAALFDLMARRFQLSVLISGHEPNRDSWNGYEKNLERVDVRCVTGWMVANRKARAGVRDLGWIHVNPGYLWSLVRTRPDAVISGEMGFRTMCALLYGTLFRRPVWVWSGATLHSERHVGWVRRAVRWCLMRLVRRWITYGELATQYLLQCGVPRGRILQVQNTVDESVYGQPTEPVLHVAPKPVLLYVGQLIPRKGVVQLLEAAGRAQADGREFSLVLVGGGPQREELQAFARHTNLRNVEFLDPLPPDQMPAVYRSADCLVLPTLEDVWGLVVNEALWSGVPVICSKFAGCAAEIVPAENRFDPLDADDFDRILGLAIDGAIRAASASPMMTTAEVADLIVDDIDAHLSRP